MISFSWLVTLLATFVAVGVLFLTFSTAKGAPQEASGAALACAIVIIPYVFTRALEGMKR